MKKIFILFAITLIALIAPSCDILEQIPETAVTNPNVWSSEVDAMSVFNSMQLWIRSQEAGGISWPSTEIRARIGVSDVRNTFGYYYSYNNDYDLYVGSGFYNWASIYKAIALANLIIDNIDAVPMNSEKKNYLKGGAYYTRAFAYFRLLILWGEAPLIASSEDVTTIEKFSKEQIFAQILKDAEAARSRLKPWSQISAQFGSTITSKQYPCLGSVDALLAHAYAWMGSLLDNQEYIEESVKAATALIDSEEYTLVSTAEEIATDVMYGNSSEGIYELDFLPNTADRNAAGAAYNLVGWPITNATIADTHSKIPTVYLSVTTDFVEDLYDEMQTDGTTMDARVYSYFCEDFETLKLTYPRAFITKWRRPIYSDDGNYKLNGFDAAFVYFRLADILLLRAECCNKLGQTDNAIADLNKVRNRSGLADYDSGVNGDLKLAILKERRRELWFEGHLFFDLIRNNELRNMVSSFSEKTQADIDDGCYYLPVPSGAFTKNPAMRQNIYWKRNGL